MPQINVLAFRCLLLAYVVSLLLRKKSGEAEHTYSLFSTQILPILVGGFRSFKTFHLETQNSIPRDGY